MVREKALSSDTMGVAICRPRAQVLAIRSRNASLILLSGHLHVRHSSSPWSTPGRQQLLVEIPLCFLYPRFHLHNAAPQSSHNRSVEGRTSAATLTGLSKCFTGNSNLRVNRVIASSTSGSRMVLRPSVLHVERARDISSSMLGSILSKRSCMSSDCARLLLRARAFFEYRKQSTQDRQNLCRSRAT